MKSLLDAGLESSGMVTIQKTQKLKDVGKPLVQLTEKASPYLLPTADKDKVLDVQKVKIADEEVYTQTECKRLDRKGLFYFIQKKHLSNAQSNIGLQRVQKRYNIKLDL